MKRQTLAAKEAASEEVARVVIAGGPVEKPAQRALRGQGTTMEGAPIG
jgi:hypothetical protein